MIPLSKNTFWEIVGWLGFAEFQCQFGWVFWAPDLLGLEDRVTRLSTSLRQHPLTDPLLGSRILRSARHNPFRFLRVLGHLLSGCVVVVVAVVVVVVVVIMILQISKLIDVTIMYAVLVFEFVFTL